MIKLYQVTNYSGLEEWFSKSSDAVARFDSLLHGGYEGDQDDLRTLEVVRCSTLMSVSEVLLANLNGTGWVDTFDVVRRAVE